MAMRRGMRRGAVFLSILYWGVVAKLALVRAAYGWWGYGPGPMSFLMGAALVYGVFFGVAWTIYGFLEEPRRRW